MKIVITGGAGYIGSHTLIELLEAGHDVLVIDNFSNSSPEALLRISQLTNRSFESAEIDVRDKGRLQSELSLFRPDAVIHFAGLKSVSQSEALPLDYFDNNVTGTISLVQAMDTAGCQSIVFSSSATVYGAAHYLPFDEAHPLAPVNPYGRTKYYVEGILGDWARAQAGRSALLLRYFNPVGAHRSGVIGEHPQGAPNNLMPYISQVAVGRRQALSIFGDDYDTPDGTGVRDYIHVTDLAQGHVRAVEYVSQNEGLDVFNLGTGQGYSVLEVVRAFEAVSGQQIPYQIVPRRAGDIASSYAEVSKARNVLGWEAQKGLAEMCADSWRWQSNNPDGYPRQS